MSENPTWDSMYLQSWQYVHDASIWQFIVSVWDQAKMDAWIGGGPPYARGHTPGSAGESDLYYRIFMRNHVTTTTKIFWRHND